MKAGNGWIVISLVRRVESLLAEKLIQFQKRLKPSFALVNSRTHIRKGTRL